MHKVLVKCLAKLARKKVWSDELTLPASIAVDWDVKNQTKQTKTPDSET